MSFVTSLRGAATAVLLVHASLSCAADIERTGGPYVPTPQTVVDAMLALAKVGADDFVIDLGSGDGRIVLTAALRYSARGRGVDIDPELVEGSNAEAKKRGIADRIQFVQEDVLRTRVDDATVLTLYLLPGMMQALQSKLLAELKPGTRIVSHDFPFGDWKPDREVSIDVPEKYGTPGQWKSTLFYWTVPARVQGSWQVTAPQMTPHNVLLTLDQRYQLVDGAANAGGRALTVSNAKVDSQRVAFRLILPEGAYDFEGTVEGDRMLGAAIRDGRSIPWSAVRTTTTLLR